jgi:hypothetical protein
MGKMRNMYFILVWKHEWARLRGRSSHEWEDNIKMGLKEMVFWSVDSIDVAGVRDRCWVLVNTGVNIGIAQVAGKFC